MAETSDTEAVSYEIYRRSLIDCSNRVLVTATPIDHPTAPGIHLVEFDDDVDASTTIYLYELIGLGADGNRVWDFDLLSAWGGVLLEITTCETEAVLTYVGGLEGQPPYGRWGLPCPEGCPELGIEPVGPLASPPAEGVYEVYAGNGICGLGGCFVVPERIEEVEGCQTVARAPVRWGNLKARF